MGRAPGHGGEAAGRQGAAPGTVAPQPPVPDPGSTGPQLPPPDPRITGPQPLAPSPCLSCPFCDLAGRELVAGNALAVAFRDGFPVNPGHTLIIPRRHVPTWFEATREEQIAILELADQVKGKLDAELKPDGYNGGFNAGAAAGQTVMHLHLHLIPRYRGDHPSPKGGVRWIFPKKAKYWDE